MLVFLVIGSIFFALVLGSVRLTQKITQELSWWAAIKITMFVMMVFTGIVAFAKKELH